jgi:hypothetical protein
MRMQSSTRFVALAALAGALACASNKARTDDGTQPEQAAAARDTTTGQDTTQNPPGYRGMERDTTGGGQHQQAPVDTFLQRQGTGAPQDTSGYSGMERVDTTSRQGQQGNQQNQANPSSQTDTSGYNANPSSSQDTSAAGQQGTSPTSGQDTSGMSGTSSQDTSGMSGMSGMDTTATRRDSTGASSGAATLDSTGMSKTGDTTGYQQSKQPQDSTSAR